MNNKRISCGRQAAKAALHKGTLQKLYLAIGTNEDLHKKANKAGVAVETQAKSQLAKIANTDKHQGVVAVSEEIKKTGWRQAIPVNGNPLIVVLDGVEDPRNLGACLRCASAMGACALVHPKRRNVSLTPAARRVASGAEEYVLVDEVTNLKRELKAMQDLGFTVVGSVPQGGVNVFEVDFKGPTAIILGGEAKGIRRLTTETCDVLVSIPMPNMAHTESLNVSVACGICLSAINLSRDR